MANEKEKAGIFKLVPKVKGTMMWVCVLLNIFFPGCGTILGGILDKTKVNIIIMGVVQFVLSPVLIGWILSLVWAFFIFKKSKLPV
mmetsp:Transcript_11615/g.17180  ORF Transcript_11615/g.17180 Transcript_11615/m.17180 type:complete len:86 (-) Transcript_11615:37-294(-)